jgi:predicted nucleic acid-binding protein
VKALIDTSIWVSFLTGRSPTPGLDAFLESGGAVTHPFVEGELRLGGADTAVLLAALPHLRVVEHEVALEVAAIAHERQLRGIGWIDCHLVAAASCAGTAILSEERAMQRLCELTGVPRG